MKKLLLKKPYFQDNPQLVEFAKKIRIRDGQMEEDQNDQQETTYEVYDELGKKKKEESLLKWGNPQFGIYERFKETGQDRAWYY